MQTISARSALLTVGALAFCYLVPLACGLIILAIPATDRRSYLWSSGFLTSLVAAAFVFVSLLSKRPWRMVIYIALFSVISVECTLAASYGIDKSFLYGMAKSSYAVGGAAALTACWLLELLTHSCILCRYGSWHPRRRARAVNRQARAVSQSRALESARASARAGARDSARRGSADGAAAAGGEEVKVKTQYATSARLAARDSAGGGQSSRVASARGQLPPTHPRPHAASDAGDPSTAHHGSHHDAGELHAPVDVRPAPRPAVVPAIPGMRVSAYSVATVVASARDTEHDTGRTSVRAVVWSALGSTPAALMTAADAEELQRAYDSGQMKPGDDPLDYVRIFRLQDAIAFALLVCHVAFAIWFGSFFATLSTAPARAAWCILYPLCQGFIARCVSLLVPTSRVDTWAYASLVLAAVPYRLLFLLFNSSDDFGGILLVEFVYKMIIYVVLQVPQMAVVKEWIAAQRQACMPTLLASAPAPTTSGSHPTGGDDVPAKEEAAHVAMHPGATAAVHPLPAPAASSSAYAVDTGVEVRAPLPSPKRILPLRIASGATEVASLVSGRFFVHQMLDLWLAAALMVLTSVARVKSVGYLGYLTVSFTTSDVVIRHLGIAIAFEFAMTMIVHVVRSVLFGPAARTTVSVGVSLLQKDVISHTLIMALALMMIVLATRVEDFVFTAGG